MRLTDPIADMLTRIRNALMVKHQEVSVPYSVMKEKILTIFRDEGYVKGFRVNVEGAHKNLIVYLKYTESGDSVIRGLKRISKPGLRVYANCEDIPKVLNGLGTAIVSINKGILTDKEARKQGVGGEVLAFIW